MEFTLTKEERRVANAASTKKGYPLHCVHIRKGIIEAADSFIAIQKKIDYDGDETMTLDSDDFVPIKDNILSQSVVFSKTEEGIKAIGQHINILYEVEDIFPDLSKVFPTGEPVFKIGLSRILLRKLLSALDDGDAPVIFAFYGKLLPVTLETDNTTALIMPMFLKGID